MVALENNVMWRWVQCQHYRSKKIKRDSWERERVGWGRELREKERVGGERERERANWVGLETKTNLRTWLPGFLHCLVVEGVMKRWFWAGLIIENGFQ